MANDFLGRSPEGDDPTATDFLGREVPVAFRAQPALPAGGPITGGAAPGTVGGAGSIGGPAGAGTGGAEAAGGPGGGPGPLQLAQQALDALGLTKKVVDRVGAPPASDFGSAATRSGVDPDQLRDAVKGLSPEQQGLLEQGVGPTPADLVPQASPEIPDVGGGVPWADPSLGGDIGTGSAVVALLLKAIAQATGNADVGHAGTATGAVGGSVAAGVSGSPMVAFAPAALGMAGMNIAKSIDEKNRVERDTASAKELMGQKVPAAVSGLGAAHEAYSSLGDVGGVPTEQLLSTLSQLDSARQGFNQVDHAFKGGVTIAGKQVDTGLPGINAIAGMDPNVPILRIQDELMRRGIPLEGIPGGRTINEWLSSVSPELVSKYGPPTYDQTAYDPETGLPGGPGGRAMSGTPWNEIAPDVQAKLGAIQPGQWESGLTQLLADLGLPPSALPGFGQQQVAQRNPRDPDPGLPATPPRDAALEQLAAFGLLPGGGATHGEEVLEAA